MKKTRILAALLCLMMVICSLPMMASAKLMAIDYDAMGAIFGTVSTVANTTTTEWPMGMKFDFKAADFNATQAGITSPAGITYDTTNGMSFPDTSVIWKYFSPYTDQWSPLAGGEGTGYTVRVKINAGGSLNLEACKKYSHERSYLIVSETGITAFENPSAVVTNTNEFVPGNDWIDIVVTPVGNGYNVYAKKASDNTFTLVAEASSFRTNGAWKSTGLTISGLKAYVSDAVMIKASNVAAIDPMEPDNTPNPGITDGLREAIGKVLGGTWVNPAVSSADWAAMTLDFTGNFNATQDGMNVSGAVSYDAVDGMVFGSESGSLRYRPTCKYNGWTPLCISNNYTFNFKLDPDGTFQTEAAKVWSGDDRVYINFANNSVAVFVRPEAGSTSFVVAENLVDYKPGTSWNDVVIKTNANNGYDLYMKKATDAEFTLVASTTTYRPGNAWNSTGFTVNAKDAKMGYAYSWVTAERVFEYASIDEILGGPAAATYAFDFDSSFDGTYWKRQGSLTSPAGITYSDENGLDMSSTTEAATWNFNAYSGWSPFSEDAAWSSYIPQAVYFKMKGKMNVQFRGPNNANRFYIDLAPNSSIGTGGGTATYNHAVNTDAGWMEYLIVPKADATAGYNFYVKGANTNNIWVKRAETSNWKTGGGNTTGFNLYAAAGTDGQVKSIRTYKVGVAESATLPAGADYLWYNDDMDSKVAYGNVNNPVDEVNGVGKFVATTETGIKNYTVTFGQIPVGGYAEYKIKSNAVTNTTFGDGEKGVNIAYNKDYGNIGAVGNYCADASSTWRTFRVVRTEAGYSIYSHVAGDTGWVPMIVNANDNVTTDGASIGCYTHPDGANNGVTYIDYLKIYGPAPQGVLTLTDGISTRVLTEGDEIGYGSDLHPIVNTDNANAKLLVVSYKGNDMLKAQIVKASELAANQRFAVSGNGADKVKVFLWDASNMNRLVPAVTLNF